jgi:hypothetical protein
MNGWDDLEKKFDKYLYTRINELKLTNITSVRQRVGESMASYIQRFRDVHSRCFSLSLSDQQLAELAFQGLIAPIRDQFTSQDFENLSPLA